jgi:hypothetical protein
MAQVCVPEDSGDMRGSANRMLGVIVGAIVVIGIVVASVASSWEATPRDPKSPEGVVQAYFEAVVAHDAEATLAFLEPGTSCTVTNFQQTYFDTGSRVNLVDVKVTGNRADVHVRIEHGNGDPFGSTWNEDQYFQLVRAGDTWRLHGIPYPLYNCGEVLK